MSAEMDFQTASAHPDGITMIPIQKYKASGSAGALCVPLGLLFGGAAAIGGGWAYHELMNLIPLVYINAVITFVYAGLIGGATGLGLLLGKCRNSTIAVAVGLVTGIAGFIVPFVLEFQSLEQFDEVAEIGWAIGPVGGSEGIPFSGPFVYLLFLIQFGVIVAFSIGLSLSLSAGAPFCESCKRYTSSKLIGRVENVDETGLNLAVAEGNLVPLLRVPLQEESGRRVEYMLHSCPSCSREKYLDLHLKWQEKKGKKKSEEKSKLVVEKVAVIDEHLEMLRNSGSFVPAETEAAATTG
jgi:hypothetical protein